MIPDDARVCPGCAGRGWIPKGWKFCANETCGKRFKFQKGRKKNPTRLNRRDAIYCSNLCAQAQASRMYRRRKAVAS